MKRFLIKIFLFVVIPFIISIPVDFGISYLLKQSNHFPGEYEVMNDIYDSKVNCDIAIYGSSRAWVHIDPQIIGDSLNAETYNFGIDGHNFWLQYLRHLELLKHNSKPKQILLSVDMFTLQKRSDLNNPDQFLPYMLWSTNIREYTNSYIGYSEADYYLPLLRYAGKAKAIETSLKMLGENPDQNNLRTKGFLGRDKKWSSEFDEAKKTIGKYEVKIDTASIDLLKKFIIECKDQSIDLAFVYTPEYIEGQDFVVNREEVINIFKELSAKNNISFLDYSDDEICSNKDLFYNANHLNKYGAEIFTKKLAHDLKIILK